MAFFNEKLKESEKDLQPLITSIKEIELYGSCEFLRDRYYDIERHLCKTAYGGLSQLSVSFILIALSGFIIMISAMFMNVRSFGVGKSGAVKPQEWSRDE